MMIKLDGFTLLESMLAVFLASLLMTVLCATFISFKACYQRTVTVSVLQDDGRFAVSVLRRNINMADGVVQIIAKQNVSAALHKQLSNISDILILKNQDESTAFYLAQASWKQAGHFVTALFEKPLDGKRQELVAHVTELHFKAEYGGISYDVTLRSMAPVLRFVQKFVDRYVSRTWYGFAAVGVHHAL